MNEEFKAVKGIHLCNEIQQGERDKEKGTEISEHSIQFDQSAPKT